MQKVEVNATRRSGVVAGGCWSESVKYAGRVIAVPGDDIKYRLSFEPATLWSHSYFSLFFLDPHSTIFVSLYFKYSCYTNVFKRSEIHRN